MTDVVSMQVDLRKDALQDGKKDGVGHTDLARMRASSRCAEIMANPSKRPAKVRTSTREAGGYSR